MISLKRYIIEAASRRAQQGFQYEINAADALKPLDVVPQNFVPARAGSKQPDLVIKRPGPRARGTAGCELKITAASAGSLVLKYTDEKWSFGEISNTDEEKIFISDLAKEIGVFDIINREWKNEPYKGTMNPRLRDEMKSLTKRQIYERDLKLFREIKGEISATKIEEYYNKKDTYYVNVGTRGFYLLGAENPLGFKNIPRFGSSAKATYRARVQYKGYDNYQFTFEMQFSIPSARKSTYNIAPIKNKNNVEIDLDKIDISFMDN